MRDMCNVTYNEEKNGIELRFDSKPTREVIDTIKAAGFHWSNRQKMWYAKKTDERMELVDSLTDGTTNTEKVRTDNVINLWELTRVENISKHPEENLSTKDAAAIIRKHLRTRFPMFKFSVTSDFDSISAYITSSPYEKDSEEVKAVLEYMGFFIESYKENTRYGFYGGKNYPRVDYDCKFTEMTVSELNIREKFAEEKAKWEAAEEVRRQKEFEEWKIEQEKAKKESERREVIRNANHKKIESNVVVKDVTPYFMENCIESWRSKEDCYDDYEEYKGDEEEPRRIAAEIMREVYMDAEIFELFKNQLMDDYSFLDKMGGSETRDRRINDMQDFYTLNAKEQQTVEWYSTNCIAVFCDNEMKFVIDPQGFSYARYCFVIDEQTQKIDNIEEHQVFSEEEFEEYKSAAESIEDISTNIIDNNGWKDTWNTDNQLDYMEAMKEWIYNNNFKFTREVVQQITISELKAMMYRVLADINSITEQFTRAGLTPGQKITIMRIGDMGGFTSSKVTFDSMEIGKYAQYDKAVKLVFKPEKKRTMYYNWFYRDVIVVDGWVELPDSLFWEDVPSSIPGAVCRRTIFLSCDEGMYDVVEKYLVENNVQILVNTHNPSNRR